MSDSKLDKIIASGTELIEFYREHPCIAARDLLKVDFAPIQRVVFRDMWFRNFSITVMSRGGGKTWMLGVLACLNCLLYPGYRVGLIGPVFRQSVIISDTYATFWTNTGLNTGANNFYNGVIPGKTKIQSNNNQNKVVSKWQDKDKACKYIKTTKGFELSGTIDHAVVCLDDNLDIDFKDLQDIKDEYIAIKTGFNYFGNDNTMPSFKFEHDCRTKDCLMPKELTPDLSYWMGLLLGDGCVSVSKNKRKQRVDFVSEDQDLLDAFENNLRKYFCVDKEEKIDRMNRRNNTWEIQYFCKKLAQYLLKCGFTKTIALDKKIPNILKKASKDNLIACLQGLYDTDGCFYVQKNKGAEITFNTSSKQLAKEVQAILLNLGIVSNFGISNKVCAKQLPQGNKLSKCSEAYKIRITGQTFIKRFNDIVGFRCLRKKEKLDTYIDNHFNGEESLAKAIGLTNKLIEGRTHKAQKLYDQGLYFVKVKEVDYFFSDTIDIEVENEECYWANGFVNHNSKMIFSEVEKLWNKSSILREASAKRPTRGSDSVYLDFKSVGGVSGSRIEGLPIGDGSKIRGSRFYLICIDELAQINESILDTVIRPMGATVLEPMENVRRLQRQKELIEMGLATVDDFDDDTVNKMIMTSSGYYKFNHMWKRMRDYWKQMDKFGNEAQYVVHQIPYWFLPEGFLDLNNIMEAKRVMSKAEFKMEYEAEMISDSEGFFKASLLEECTIDSGFSVELAGLGGSEYIVCVDPNQGGSASCGIVVVKLGSVNKIVNVIELKTGTTQDLTKAVQSLCKAYNVVRIVMDKGGGGKAICDLLEEGYGGTEPIIDLTNDDHRSMEGKHILDMVNFSPSWISDANFSTLSLFEDKKIKFPEPAAYTSKVEDTVFDAVKTLKSQILNIVVTQKSSGVLHFDTPKKDQNKDLYSALILAGYGIRVLEREQQDDCAPALYNVGGMVRQHKAGSDWCSVVNDAPNGSMLVSDLAVLNKKF